MLSKNVNNRKCALKFVFFNEKKNQKGSDDFVSPPENSTVGIAIPDKSAGAVEYCAHIIARLVFLSIF